MFINILIVVILFITTPVFSAQNWTEYSGTPIVSGTETWEGNAVFEPRVLRISTNNWFMVYSGYNGTHQNLGTATASAPEGPWTKNPANPVIGNGNGSEPSDGVGRSFLYLESGTIYWFYTNNVADMYVQQSTDNGVTFNSRTKVLDHVTNAAGGCVGFQNSSIVKVGATYNMMVECNIGGSGGFAMYRATSSSLISGWTVNSTQLTNLQIVSGGQYGGPNFHYINGQYFLWYHACNINSTLPSDIYFSTSGNLDQWTPPVLTFPRSAEINLGAFPGGVIDQVADAYVYEANGNSYAYYDRDVNSPSLRANITVQTYSGTLSQLLAQSRVLNNMVINNATID